MSATHSHRNASDNIHGTLSVFQAVFELHRLRLETRIDVQSIANDAQKSAMLMQSEILSKSAFPLGRFPVVRRNVFSIASYGMMARQSP